MSDVTGGYRPPSDADVDRAVAALHDVQHRRVFFGGLKNPLWLQPLDERGVFGTPDNLEERADGALFSPPWPEGEYLAIAADMFPERVTQILERMADTRNLDAQRAVLACARRLPAPLAGRLVKFIRRYLTQPFAEWLEPTELAELAERLLLEGERQGVELADALYFPRPRAQAGFAREAEAGLEAYWYAETLPRVAKALVEARGLHGLKKLCRWLDRYQKVIHPSNGQGSSDVSYVWRPSIAPSEQNTGFEEIGDTLVDAVRDGAAALAQVHEPAVIDEILTSRAEPLFTRLGLNFLTQVADQEGAKRLLRERLLSSSLLRDYRCRHEYAVLARAALLRFDEADQEQWVGLVRDGPEINDRIRAMLAAEARNGDPDQSVEVYRATWIRDLLGAIGEDSLPAAARALLAQLQEVHGPPSELADFPVRMGEVGRVGPNSPLSPDDIAALDVPVLIRTLREWEPSGERFGPSREGFGSSLKGAVAQGPERFAAQAELFKEVHPTYIRALLDGLEAALREERTFSWEKVLDLAAFVAAQDPSGSPHWQPTDDEDRGWEWSQKSVASLLELALRSRPPTLHLGHAKGVASILEALLRNENPTAEYEAEYAGDNMDPLTLSLNTVRPVTVRAAIWFLSWLTAVEQAPEEHPAGVQVLAALERLAGPDREQSLAVHAAFGEGLGRLAHHAPKWTRKHLYDLLGETSPETWRSGHDVVWSTALATHRPSRALVELLRPQLLSRLVDASSGYTPTPGWRTQDSPWELIGRHIVALVANGVLDFEDPVVLAFFGQGPKGAISRTMSRWGWILFRTDGELDAEFLERCRQLWDWRAESVASGAGDTEELAGFGWWARSGRFEPEWWLPRLKQAAVLGVLDIRNGVVETLTEAAHEHPQAVFEIYEALIETREEGPSYESYRLRKSAPAIIAVALDSGDEALGQRANALMNRLGQEGQIALAQEVRELRQGKTEGPPATPPG